MVQTNYDIVKKIFFILLLLTGSWKSYSQDSLQVKKKIDSIIYQISIEKNPSARDSLLLSILLTKIEGFPHLALYTYEKLDELSDLNNDDVIRAFALSMAGHGYRMSGNYIRGLEYHHKAIALAERINDPVILTLAKILMAHLYRDRQEYKLSLELYLSANKLDPALPNAEQVIEWSRPNLSRVYLANNQLDSALYYAINTQNNKKENPYYNAVLSVVGAAYSKMGRNAEAVRFFNIAIAYGIKDKRTRVLQETYLNYADHFKRNHQQDSAIFYAKKALVLVTNNEFGFLSLAPAKLLMDLYKEDNADSTLKYLRIYSAANDSLYSTRANQQLQMMTFEEDQRQRNMAAEKLSYQNKIKMLMLLAGIIIFCLITIILYRNNLQRKKANVVLEKTLADLKATQAQLVQSEKMASLGELTAGIAHEIQNPLNFVNNFSEVSSELVDEMNSEIEKGDMEETKAIAADIKSNLEKINHHGKRADAIVKGMLQHSQSSKGQKEPTDINALADEYLRLAYHGLRAKDKSFNATLKTEYDETIGKVNIISQDIGRVLLNLFTNAFYAVNLRGLQNPGGLNQTLSPAMAPTAVGNGTSDFEPTVSIKTSKIENRVQITVSDNGNGIPNNIIDKIFQPFFTTKPTGQGTGLGLSLAYDIVKGHNGELKVKTKEGEGTTFNIILNTNG